MGRGGDVAGGGGRCHRQGTVTVTAPVFAGIPPEPPRIITLDGCAPKFGAAVVRVMDRMASNGQRCIIGEALRTNARQHWLYGFGREWNDGRGIVTKAKTIWNSWHGFGLAVDIWHAQTLWRAPSAFWLLLADAAKAEGLFPYLDHPTTKWDQPHVQWGNGMRVSPSWRARALYESGGMEAVWKAVGAV